MLSVVVCRLGLQAEDRSIDGFGNNIALPNQGAAGMMFSRLASAHYDDGISEPKEIGMPNAREISNTVCEQLGPMPNPYGLSGMVWQWGQFIDHDITLSETSADGQEAFPIAVAAGDILAPVIPMMRTRFDPGTGTSPNNPREQVNSITSYLDGSMIYGSDTFRAAYLQAPSGGRLETSDGDLLPFNVSGLANANPTGLPEVSLFFAGDVRANEHLGLISMHTVFVREHNRLSGEIAGANPQWTHSQVYNRARKIVGAQIQSITYNEFLPALLGSLAPDFATLSYDPARDASITNEFATAFYRVGHTMVSSQFMLVQDDGNIAPGHSIPTMDAFFTPATLVAEPGLIDLILKGLATHSQEDVDTRVIDDLRHQLFGAPGSGGMDLVSLNIQRGRDHGLPSYNEMRQLFGLDPALDFSQVTSDPAIQAALEDVYSNVDEIELWVGALAENHIPGGPVGELIAVALEEQFINLAEGDRFFLLFDPELEDLRAELMSTTLSDIIRRNTSLTNLQANVFFVSESPKPLIASISFLPESGDVQLSIVVDPAKTYTLQRSFDLTVWETILSGLSGEGLMTVTDPGAAALYTEAFYRFAEETSAP